SPGALAQRFGPRQGPELARRARFDDAAPVSQERKTVSESREVTFDTDIADAARLEAVMDGLAERLWTALVAQDRQGRTVSINVRLADFSTYTRAQTLAEPVASGRQLEQVAMGLLRRHPPARPVRLLGVRVAGLEAARLDCEEQLALGV